MSVKLITITPDAEATMAYIARVSSPNQGNPDYAKLLAYCIRNKHHSVFEHAFMTLEVNTSRAIARQILRHRSFTFSEFSQRYAEVGDERVIVAARRQDSKNRQNSIDDLDGDIRFAFAEYQSRVWRLATDYYYAALDEGVAKECARALLPEGLTPSRLYMSGSVRSFIHWIELRTGNGTQLEHQELALEAKKIFCEQLPTVAAALGWNT